MWLLLFLAADAIISLIAVTIWLNRPKKVEPVKVWWDDTSSSYEESLDEFHRWGTGL